MATAKSNRNTRNTRTAGRRTGRPTNAERALRQQSETAKLINVAAASYAAGMANALGVVAYLLSAGAALYYLRAVKTN